MIGTFGRTNAALVVFPTPAGTLVTASGNTCTVPITGSATLGVRLAGKKRQGENTYRKYDFFHGSFLSKKFF